MYKHIHKCHLTSVTAIITTISSKATEHTFLLNVFDIFTQIESASGGDRLNPAHSWLWLFQMSNCAQRPPKAVYMD